MTLMSEMDFKDPKKYCNEYCNVALLLLLSFSALIYINV